MSATWVFFFFQAEDGIRDWSVTGVQTCALPIWHSYLDVVFNGLFMEFRIADTFTDSLAKLTGEEQKAVKTTAFDLQINTANPGMQLHKLRSEERRVGKEGRTWA